MRFYESHLYKHRFAGLEEFAPYVLVLPELELENESHLRPGVRLTMFIHRGNETVTVWMFTPPLSQS